jgi:DNA polymerase-1
MDTQDPIADPFTEAEPKPAGGRTLYLVDGSGYIFRAFHALPPLPRADGVQINAVLGFTNMLVKLLQDIDADRLAVIFDAGRNSFRNEIYPEYKANRGETPPELIPQFPLVREATRAFNVPAIELDQYEADDLIASYAKAAAAQGDRVVIVSSDKDLMQLVSEQVTMLDPIKNRPIGPAEVFEKFGVSPDKVVDVQALCGDSTDNVPGVRGIGVKTAAELITTYGSLDALLARAGEIKQPKRRESLIEGEKAARLSRELVTLRDDVALPVAIPRRCAPSSPRKASAPCWGGSRTTSRPRRRKRPNRRRSRDPRRASPPSK